MSYTKTIWVDNTTPINSTNMNKIEQGIYDNSLAADTLNNVVKPNDETYKSVEITEGQITDVLGVNDVLIKGNTLQDGEPTPSAPVDVNVVSGDNVIEIKSKNLININTLSNGYVLGTGGINTQSTNEEMYSEFIKVKPNTAYTFKIFETTWSGFNLSNWIGIGEYGSIQNPINHGFIQRDIMGIGTQNYYTITTTTNTNYIIISAKGLVSATKIQLEIGSTATDYTPYYPGKELPLDLGAIELCKIGDYQDCFYRDNGKWYLHKETEKIVLGNYNWTLSNNTSISNEDTNRWVVAYTNSRANNAVNSVLSNILPKGTAISSWDNDTLQIAQSISQLIIRMPVEYTTTAEVKTALEDLNGYAICLMNNGTNTEITDTTLISQLEAIYNAPLYEQTNITQTNNDLPVILDITAFKDNINGIKAFIRK